MSPLLSDVISYCFETTATRRHNNNRNNNNNNNKPCGGLSRLRRSDTRTHWLDPCKKAKGMPAIQVLWSQPSMLHQASRTIPGDNPPVCCGESSSHMRRTLILLCCIVDPLMHWRSIHIKSCRDCWSRLRWYQLLKLVHHISSASECSSTSDGAAAATPIPPI